MLNAVYKLRYDSQKRKKWEAAAKLRGDELSRWIRDVLDEAAQIDLVAFSKK